MKRIRTAGDSAETPDALSFILASSLWVGTQSPSKLQSTFPTSAQSHLPFGIFCLVKWDTHLFPPSTQPISPEVLSSFISLLGLCWSYPPSEADLGHTLCLSHLLISPASPNAEGRCLGAKFFLMPHTLLPPGPTHSSAGNAERACMCVCTHPGVSEAGDQGQEWKSGWGD